MARVKNRKQQIIRQATRLFSGQGYYKVSMKQIAAACEITDAALYKHFDSKESLYLAVLESLQSKISTERLFAKIENEDDIETILIAVARHIINSYKKHQTVLRLLLFSSLQNHKLTEQIYGSIRLPYVTFLTKKIKQLIKDGKVGPVNPAITARCFVGMVFDCSLNFCLWKGMSGKQFNMKSIIENNVPIYTRGLTKNKK